MMPIRVYRDVGIIALLLLSFGSSAHHIFGQNRSTISGMVLAPGERPVTQAPVELLNDTNSVIQRTRTDISGRYVFNGVAAGRFAIRVLPLGTNLEEQVQEVQVGGMSVDRRRPLADNIQLDFLLVERRNRDQRPQVNATVFAQEIPPAARKYYESAVSELNKKKVAAAEVSLQNALREFPLYYLALVRLGMVEIGLGKFDEAQEAFSRAVAVNDRSLTGWYGLSYSEFALNKTPAAITAAQKALEIDRSSAEIFLLLGVMQRRVKDYVVAEKSLLQAKKLDKGHSPDIHWNLALLYAHNLRNYGAAATELDAYLKLVPNVPNRSSVEKLIRQFRQKAAETND